MSDKFKFTQEDLDNMVLEALNAQSGENQGGERKPNVLEILKSKTGLNRISNERQGS